MTIRFNPIRDTLSAVIGFSSAGVGLVGTAAKKAFIADDSSMAKKVGIGALVTVFTGFTGLIPYVIAAPGARHELQDEKSAVVDNRYG